MSIPDYEIRIHVGRKCIPEYSSIRFLCMEDIAPRVYVVHNIQGPL